MLTTNEALTKEDLIRPLSLEALEYFASGAIPVLEGETPLRCKFIRYGGVLMIGAAIQYGREDTRGKKSRIFHIDLLGQLERDKEAYVAASAVGDTEPFTVGGRRQGIFNDGGFATIGIIGQSPVELLLSGDSFDFGRGDCAARQRSVEVAQLLVGDRILVDDLGF